MRFRIVTVIAIVSGLSLLGGVGSLSYRNALHGDKDGQSVIHTYVVLERIDALAVDVTDAVSAERGYALIGDDSYWRSCQEELRRVSANIQSLRQLTADNARQQHNLDLLEPLVQSKVDQMRTVIEQRKVHGVAAAAEIIQSPLHQNLMTAIRKQVAAMTGEERSLLQQRTENARIAFRNTRLAIVFGNALAFGLLLFAGMNVRQQFAERQRAENALRASELQVRNLNQSLENRVNELTSANRELDAFTYSLAHDLRAPLRHIRGFADLLWQNLHQDLADENRHFLSTVVKSSKEMGILVDELLKFARLGRAQLQRSQVDLNKVVKEVQRELQSETQDRVVGWEIGNLPTVAGDVVLLRQVFMNLLSNAVKYTRKCSQAHIGVGSENDDSQVTVFVRDNGAGFEMKYASKLFGVFQRLHRPEEFEGTGIGLANVRRIIERHGGRVWAESEPGRGATFYFSLPAAREMRL